MSCGGRVIEGIVGTADALLSFLSVEYPTLHSIVALLNIPIVK